MALGPRVGNFFADFSEPAVGEDFAELLRLRNLRIERIVSGGSPEPLLYDQVQDEWVILLEGRATLQIAGETVDLGPGDFLFIPAHTRHSVLATSPTPRCVWLAVHLFPDNPQETPR
jgi:cupin 2 domain-containing protein